jgi:thioredoxin-like negative regulator of GroEL
MKHAVARACAVLAVSLLAGCDIGVEQGPQAAARPSAPASAQQRAAHNTRVARGLLRFVEGYQQGYRQAVSDNKPMLLFFTAEWCQFCHQMADEAFTHPQVVSLSEHFVCVLIDADSEPDICRQFEVTGYPTIQFLSPRGVPLQRVVGKRPGHQLMMAMQAALQNVARRSAAGEETAR